MMRYKNVAIVLGGGLSGLGVTRNLGRNGVDVYCIVDSIDEAIYSRYCKKYLIVPNIQKNKAILQSFLNRIEGNFDDCAVVFPTTDLFSLHLSELKDDLTDNYHALVPKKEATRTLVDKKLFYQSLSDSNIPCPATLFPKSVEDVKRICKDVEYPIFIKPSISQVFYNKFGKKGFVANSPEELMKYYRLVLKHKIEVVLQEIISGPASNIYGIAGYFGKGSCPKALFAYHRLRSWPPFFGTNSMIESVPISDVPSISNITKNYLRDIGYYGIFEAEFKKDPRDGIFKLLEINARSWWQNSLPTRCGINIVLRAYLEAIGKKTEYKEDYEVGLKWMIFLNDLRAVIKTKSMSLKGWCTSLKDVKDWAYFSLDDVSPCIVVIILTPYRLLRSFSRRGALALRGNLVC